MTKTQKIWTGIGITAFVLAVIGVIIYSFRKSKPGVYAPYKCNQQGDDTNIYRGKNGMEDNFKARGAVCDGLYIPIGAKLFGQNTTKVLEWMGELYNTQNFPEAIAVKKDKNLKNMILLAQAAAYQASISK